MRKSITLVLLAFLTIGISCAPKTQNCEIREIKTLFSIPEIYEGDTTYSHYALINGFSRACADSATMVGAALRYADTVKVGSPVELIMFFNSDKDFIPNEISQPKEINKSCLVVISVNNKTKSPKNFMFYNEWGIKTYWGKKWLPDGDESNGSDIMK